MRGRSLRTGLSAISPIPTRGHTRSYAPIWTAAHPADGSELDLHQVYQKCAPSVVAVTAFIDEKHDDRYYWGTGIILTEDGYIVTNSHVVEGSCRARVTLWNDSEYDVALVGYDKRSDIAVLKINAKGLIPMASSSPAVSGCAFSGLESSRRNSSAVDTEKAGLATTTEHSGRAGSGVRISPLPSARAKPPSTQ